MNTPGKELTDLIGQLFGYTFGENLFYLRQPDVHDTDVIWLTLISGDISRELKTRQQVKEYNFTLNYRNVSAREVDSKLNEFENILSHLKCFELPSYKVYSLRVSNLGSQEDADTENRFKGAIQIRLRIYDDYSN